MLGNARVEDHTGAQLCLPDAFPMPGDAHGSFCPQPWRMSRDSRSPLRLLNADKALGRSGNLRVGTKLPAPTFSVFLEQASSGIFYLGERIAKSQDKG